MARIFFLGIVFYLVYRLIFDLIFPVYKTTRQVKKQFNDIHARMQQDGQASPKQPSPGPDRAASAGTKTRVGEYIDFEEIK